MRAIAAMSLDRVIGKGNAIPWRIPDEFKWFRRTTLGGVVVMGRRTFESLPKPLDGRVTAVLTRNPGQLDPARLAGADVRVVDGLDALEAAGLVDRAWLCGGVQLYEQFLPRCAELYLSVVDRHVEGDAFFPPFEHLFDLSAVVLEHPEFRVLHYVRNGVPDRR